MGSRLEGNALVEARSNKGAPHTINKIGAREGEILELISGFEVDDGPLYNEFDDVERKYEFRWFKKLAIWGWVYGVKPCSRTMAMAN